MKEAPKGEDEEPLLEPNQNQLSSRRNIRTSSSLLTAANIMKMQIGISFISVSKSISQVGIYCSLIGFAYTVAINIWSVWLMLQTRNKFKDDPDIIDVCDLSVKLYGESTRKYLAVLLVVSNCLFGMAYEVYFGSQLDQLMCQTL